jgi:endonuclease/exonuclease/phosphatase family metal-dependent hydrolase
MTAFPSVASPLVARKVSRRAAAGLGLRGWSIVLLVMGTLLGGTTLALAGTDKGSAEYGQMGVSPMPVVGTVSGPTSFRVSSFNILGYDHTDGGRGSKKGYADGALRMKWATQLIKSHQVDVVGLQEFQPPQYDKWLRKAAGQYDMFPGYIDSVGFLRNSIAWRKDKFRLVSSSWLKLPYFHGDVLRMPIVLLQSIQTGQQVYFINFQNPADVRGNASKWRLIGQRLQIALVNQLKVSNNLPVIWTGDFNARKQAFCRVTKQAGMVSASGGYRSDTTCQPPAGMVVDWIFGSQVQFSNYVADRSKKVVRTTDHHMLVTDALVQPVEPIIPPPPPVTTTPTTTPSTPPPTQSTPTVTITP